MSCDLGRSTTPTTFFACSSAQQYQWVKEDYPPLYDRIKASVAAKKFVPVGGTWVEMDCNMPCGEALIRQFLLGQRFFQAEFGVRCREFWLPDTFGYAAQLPQICKLAGIEYFLTTKLSWNSTNEMPFNTFYWKGIDGTSVLAHFPPGSIQADGSVRDTWSAFSNRDLSTTNHSVMLYGWGDGGGGPTEKHFEQLIRCQDVSPLPKVEFSTPEKFFDRIKAEETRLATWTGELYLELHRGTYTTHGIIKRYNRTLEASFRSAEFLCASAVFLGSFMYPASELERVWQKYLLNQFHDVLPGTSIKEVTTVALEMYADVDQTTAALISAAKNSIFLGGTASTIAFNSTGVSRVEIVELPAALVPANERPLQMQSDKAMVLGVVEVDSFGWSVVPVATSVSLATPAPVRSAQAKAKKHLAKTVMGSVRENGTVVLENSDLILTLSPTGTVASLYDKRADREVMDLTGSPQGGNTFHMFEDCPTSWDAWDTEFFHYEKEHALPAAGVVTLLEQGPLRAVVRITQQLSATSLLVQHVTMTSVSNRIDFVTDVDWVDEVHRFLKVRFPLAVHSPQAAYEIQHGHTFRPTHKNTSWDDARFEVCAQRWADLSEYGYGVALLNDCKYGHACQENVFYLSLIRAPKYPDNTADLGQHRFTYSIFPHLGNLQDGGVIAEATKLNNPLSLHNSASVPGPQSLLSVESPAVVLDWVKMAEDSQELIVRLYESFGGRVPSVWLRSTLPIAGAAVVNILEEPMDSDAIRTPWADGQLELSLKPFQILTLRLTLAAGVVGRV
eukprot:TRINITY_DN2128_c0_g1_i4.p1 TRINITY_DN2128_c0_g1~~TRINITY_DN2128_c0_g1_i4.p1  ORF type:complete len:787 (+),score=162.79 TRINITY_DN2128_c0_g1_i4:794-3154(+)